MKLRKFQAANMREALADVKAALGPDAMIVATRDIRRGLLGSGVEVTAAIDDEEDKPAAKEPARASTPPTGAPSPYAAQSAHTPQGPYTPQGSYTPQSSFALTEGDVERIMAPLRSELRTLRAQLRAPVEPDTKGLETELASMRQTIEALRDLVPGARAKVTREQLTERARTTTLAAPALARVIALIGPTGVGKTTTIAKIAAREALIALRTVAIVSLDTYRVGGQEQIRIFAELIGVPVYIVHHLEDLPGTIAQLGAYDRILIDTAGRSPRDADAIRALVEGLLRVPDIEIHLALAATSDAGLIDAWLRRYGSGDIDRLLFTKVDEASDLSELVSTPARTGKPISWLTTGQRVPEDIEDATAARLLGLATGGFSTFEEEAA
ncbi:flagellar biosynthesis protein FlhF [Myxococcota bacterium]|nr:flagellar biosynthesis protein FlhF [Myxococcota bacterium]